MSIKLILLKSGEDLIANINEMAFGENESRRVVGYILNRPCILKMMSAVPGPGESLEEEGNLKKSGYNVSLFPWIPLSADEDVPIPADWVVTIVEPTPKLKEMYVEDVANYGKQNNQSTGTTEQSDSDNAD